MIVDDAGAAMVEYAIVAAAVAVPIIGVAVAIATGAGSALNTTSAGIQNYNQSPP